MPQVVRPIRRIGLATVLLVLSAGCVDEEVVFRDRELFEEPLEVAGQFLGYTDGEAKLTVCGNCHIGVQRDWAVTAHASAWSDLQDSGEAQGFCEGCHTVSELGNVTTGIVGHAATGEARYQDVQCESCHGPGLVHVRDPRDETVPRPALDVGLDLTLGCAECHQGAHQPFADEWAESGHGSVVTFPADRPECWGCHTGENALANFGVRTTFLEEDRVSAPGEHLPITCAVCHDPHGSENSAQLRFPIDVPNEDQNLCMKCHSKRGTPDPTNFRGPHSPEGPTLLGTAGWWPPNLTFPGGKIVGTHGSVEANPRLCASCHVQKFEVTDQETGAFVFSSTGHLFEATPCLDAQGVPTRADDCADEDRLYTGCATSGCHSTPATARDLRSVTEARIERDAADLEALIPLIPADEFDPADGRFSVGEGAQFNLELARAGGAAIHNPFLIEALLIATIDAVEETYGVMAVPPREAHGGS